LALVAVLAETAVPADMAVAAASVNAPAATAALRAIGMANSPNPGKKGT
jgi:hypothetical protein